MPSPSIAAVNAALGGPELRHGRCRAWWRGGDGLNISFRDEDWYDHVTGEGGGPLQLAQAVLGVSEGRRWFVERYGSRGVPCQKARRVPAVADELVRRMVAALADLRKQIAKDDADLALWANIDRIVRTGGVDWRRFRERVEISDPELYRHWLRCAVEFEADSRRAAALVVAMLAEVSA